MNGYFVGMAMTAAVLYLIKKRKFVDEESDTLFVKAGVASVTALSQ